MIRLLLRLAGFMLIAAGFVMLVIDGTRSIAGRRIIATPLGETWRSVHFDSLVQLQKAVEAGAPAWAWDPVAVTVLALPTAGLGLATGALLMLAGRRPEPRIGVVGRR